MEVRYCSIFWAIELGGTSLEIEPCKIGLMYPRYLQFRFLNGHCTLKNYWYIMGFPARHGGRAGEFLLRNSYKNG